MSEKRFCKKCGRELASINDGELCQNCRRERGNLLKKIGGAIGSVLFVVTTIWLKRKK